MSQIKKEKMVEVSNKTLEAYFNSKETHIEVEIDEEFENWIKQQEAQQDFKNVIETVANKIHLEGGLLNQMIITTFEFQYPDDGKIIMRIEYDFN